MATKIRPGKRVDDKGCPKMTKFLGEKSSCKACYLPKCAEDMVSIWWDGLAVGEDIGIKRGVRAIVELINGLQGGVK